MRRSSRSGPCASFCLNLGMARRLDPRIKFQSLRLPSQIKRVHENISVAVELASRPLNLHHVSPGVIIHSEMHPQIVAGEVTFAAADIQDAPLARHRYSDPGANTGAIAAYAFRPYYE